MTEKGPSTGRKRWDPNIKRGFSLGKEEASPTKPGESEVKTGENADNTYQGKKVGGNRI